MDTRSRGRPAAGAARLAPGCRGRSRTWLSSWKSVLHLWMRDSNACLRREAAPVCQWWSALAFWSQNLWISILIWKRGKISKYGLNIVKISKSRWPSKYQNNGSIDAEFCEKSVIFQHFLRSTRKSYRKLAKTSDFAENPSHQISKYQNIWSYFDILPLFSISIFH